MSRTRARVEAVPGVKALTQVFPDELDDELLRMFVVEVDSAQTSRVINALRALSGVETVELPGKRTVRALSPVSGTGEANGASATKVSNAVGSR